MLKFVNGDNLYWSADLHINHVNICYSTSSWANKETSTRRFDSINQMNKTIIENINKEVGYDDHLFLLGDHLFRFKSTQDYETLFSRFTCNNIYILYGNHCHRENLSQIKLEKVKYIGDYLEIQVGGKLICMSHYPFTYWHDNHKESWNLFGHIHGNYTSPKKQLDVGVDSAFKIFGEYRPFSFEEIREIMNTKQEIKHNGRII